MELLDGLDLDTLVKQHGPLPAEQVVHLLRQVCSALEDAHANGLVKLDSPRVADKDAIKLSAEDSWSGTPGYMAPEVVLGAADTDHRVDLYALGCVAYWLLTGTMVFEGENAMQVMVQHVQAEPKRPSERVDLPIPAALEELVMDCLEKDPARRPASADVVSERLGAVPLTSVWTAERAEQWWAMHRPRPRDAR